MAKNGRFGYPGSAAMGPTGRGVSRGGAYPHGNMNQMQMAPDANRGFFGSIVRSGGSGSGSEIASAGGRIG